MKQKMLDDLRLKYEADYKQAKITLEVYLKNSVGIGEHKDIFIEMNQLVDDMANASLFIHNLDNDRYEKCTKKMQSHINIGTGLDITIKELAQNIKDTVGFKGKLTFDQTMPDGTPRKLMNTDILKSLGWKPKTSLASGLNKCYEDFLLNYRDFKVVA